jgi:predicted N-acyltransferase
MVKPLKTRYQVAWLQSLTQVPSAAWDALALSLPTPFLEWTWLNHLETSGSATARTGWLPNHLTLWRDRELVAAAPLYIKGHSYGEFVFDHQWADLAGRLGLNYYPKLLGMSPFTPAEGYRFLIAPGEDEETLTELLVREIDQFCLQHRISGCNFLYVDPDWKPLMERHGFRSWLHHSYIWKNQGFQSFEDYLGAFNANQRRNIKRERKAVSQTGLQFRPLSGDEISLPLLSQMYDFYSDTCDKFGWWGSKYLTRQFFEQLHQDFRQRLVLFAAMDPQQETTPIAMSFCLSKGDRLYGRYWGSQQEIDCLHFDACYYTPIAWAIDQGMQMFDPGAGGRHKQRRGFPATPNYSLHRFYPPRLRQLLDTHIDPINRMEQEEINTINQDLPFKQ